MIRKLTLIAAASLALTCGKKEPSAQTPEPTAMSFHELTTKTLEGKPADLSVYKGKVLLVVNTASECGATPQYAGLEKLYDDYKAKGVVVLGFPSNDFGKQEPGTAAQIQTFCRSNYGIEFPMFEKVVTSGAGQSPVYKFLTAKHGPPKWNFHKYLVGKDGQVKQAFPTKTEPLAPEILAAIDAELAK